MNSLYRSMIALSTVLPLTIPFAFVFADKWVDPLLELFPGIFCVVNPIIAGIAFVVFLNWVFGVILVHVLDTIACNYLGKDPIKVESVRMLGGDSMMGYLPYVLPLFISQSSMQPVIGWVIGAFVLLILALLSSTIPFSPLLKICGLQFFEVELADRRVVTLLIRNRKLRPLRLKKGVAITDFCVYGVE